MTTTNTPSLSADAIDVAAWVSTRPEFSSIESPLILNIIEAAFARQRAVKEQPTEGAKVSVTDAQDAARYRWLEDRMDARPQQMMAGPSRNALMLRIGFGVEGVDTDPSSGWTSPIYFEEAKERVRNFIDAAIAKSVAGKKAEGRS